MKKIIKFLIVVIALFTSVNLFSQNCYVPKFKLTITGSKIIDTCDKQIYLNVSYSGKPTYIYWNDGYYGSNRIVEKSGNYQAFAVDNFDTSACVDSSNTVRVDLNENYLNIYSNIWGTNNEISVCSGRPVELNCYSTGKIRWSTGDSSSIILANKTADYFATMTSKNGCVDTSNVIKVKVISFNSLNVKALGDTIFCLGDSIELELTNTKSKHFWMPTYETSKKIKVGTQGTYYVYAYDSASGCDGYSNKVNVTVLTPPIVQLCMVTVDSVSNKNKLIWKKTNQNIVSYNIYKESNFAGEFDFIGNVDYNSESNFIDSWSNPKQRPFTYYIAAVDSCGNEAFESKYYTHTTLHLTANLGVTGENNLNWSNYYGIYPLSTYIIYRSNKGNKFEAIGSVASTVNSYSDLEPPSGSNRYFIGIKGTTECVDTQVVISSNLVAFDIANFKEFEMSQVDVHPNPFDDVINIQNVPVGSIIEILNIHGQSMLSQKSSEVSPKLNVSGISPGIYFLKINNSISFKVIKK